MKFIRTWLIFCAAVLLAWQSIAVSSEQIKITIGSWVFEEKQAENLDFNLTLTDVGIGIKATADVVNFAEPIGQINNVSLSCDELQFNSQQIACLKGDLAFTHAKLASQKIQFSIKAKPETTNYRVSIKGFKLAETDVLLQAELENDNWHVLLDIPTASLKNITTVLSAYLSDENIETLASWSYEADLSIKAELSGQKKQLQYGNVNLATSTLNLSDKDGLFVAENTAMLLDLDLKLINQDWQWQADIKIDNGQAYGEPVFLDFSESALSFSGNGLWQTDKKSCLLIRQN